MRLIDADELKEVLHETIADEDRAKYWYDLIGVDDAIDFSPTITFNPPKHGRWQKYRYPFESGMQYIMYQCSECDARFQEVGYGWPYCPECGARMDGGNDNEID